jgi:MFS family permease
MPQKKLPKYTPPILKSPYSIPNIRLFILFRCCFTARFYYPVFTILFLDYGLTIEQFSLLNTIWAITIVCAEVPSGALADVLGRKYLLITTAVLMIIEMTILAVVPTGNSTIIFQAFLVNRILSGLAESMASGADEAIAYDSLVQEGMQQHWAKVLTTTYRVKALTAVFSLTLGSLIYAPSSVNSVLAFLGIDVTLTQQTTMRFPIYGTLIFAVFAFFTAIQMKEVTIENPDDTSGEKTTVVSAFFKTLDAGRWILRTPFALAIILFGMCFDHVLRLIVTFTSQYYRCIDLPDASFGAIGATLSLLAMVTPKIAEVLCEERSPRTNMIILAILTLLSLFGLAQFSLLGGLFFVATTTITMTFVSFMVSNYLNIITDSKRRATVLSFKGMAFNIAYGLISFFFALLLTRLRSDLTDEHPLWATEQIADAAFMEGITWIPWFTLLALIVLIFICNYLLRNSTDHLNIPIPNSEAKQ